MAIIVPTITAEEPHAYRSQIEARQDFAPRLHIDLMDGIFTTNKSVDVSQVWWPEAITADIHLMFQNPEDVLGELIELKPHIVIVQAESDCDVVTFSNALNQAGIGCGLSIFPETTVESVSAVLNDIQQVLLFSGNLGHQGGSTANLELLSKVAQIKRINPNLEIAWDGGVNDLNVSKLAEGGVDVINVGGYIQSAQDTGLAYKTLTALLP